MKDKVDKGRTADFFSGSGGRGGFRSGSGRPPGAIPANECRKIYAQRWISSDFRYILDDFISRKKDTKGWVQFGRFLKEIGYN